MKLGELVLLPRRPLPPENGVLHRNCETGETRLIRECQDPIHVFASAEDGAVCQCGSCRWHALSLTGVHVLGGCTTITNGAS